MMLYRYAWSQSPCWRTTCTLHLPSKGFEAARAEPSNRKVANPIATAALAACVSRMRVSLVCLECAEERGLAHAGSDRLADAPVQARRSRGAGGEIERLRQDLNGVASGEDVRRHAGLPQGRLEIARAARQVDAPAVRRTERFRGRNGVRCVDRVGAAKAGELRPGSSVGLLQIVHRGEA